MERIKNQDILKEHERVDKNRDKDFYPPISISKILNEIPVKKTATSFLVGLRDVSKNARISLFTGFNKRGIVSNVVGPNIIVELATFVTHFNSNGFEYW